VVEPVVGFAVIVGPWSASAEQNANSSSPAADVHSVSVG
jgi:hypothetical protein